MNIIGNAWANGAILMIIVAILFPVLAWATQYFTLKLTASATNQDVPDSMQTMNKIMPVISAVFTFSLPTGIGIYLIIGAIVRAVQMIIINKQLDKESIEDIMKKAQEKENKKRAKRGLPPQKITNTAHVSTKSLDTTPTPVEHKESKAEQMQKRMKDSSDHYDQNKAKGSGKIAQKANMVSLYNEKNEKKKK
jgi:YidC/Oxa1 family membrane protein insertase